MRKTLFLILLFLIGNAILAWLHIQVFQSPYPFLVFVSATIHIVSLIFFPYQKLTK